MTDDIDTQDDATITAATDQNEPAIPAEAIAAFKVLARANISWLLSELDHERSGTPTDQRPTLNQ